MSTTEIRVTDGDSEIAAMKAISRAMESLDRAAAKRVVEWARTRYVDRELVGFGTFDSDGFEKFTTALREAANRLGDIAPIDIVRFGEYVRAMKEREEAAA